MGRLLRIGLAALCVVSSFGAFGCSHESPATPKDSGTDKAPSNDVRGDTGTDSDGGQADTAGGSDAPVEPPKTDIRLILSEKAVKLTEGSTALTGTFTVTLSHTSPSPFIVTVLTGNPNVATVVPETLEFAANEIGPKEVTVIPVTDDDTVDNSTVVTLSSPETGSASVAVDVKDSDVQTLIVPAKVSMTEGRTEPLSVRLFKRPASSVVVTLTSSNPTKLSLGTTTLTFDSRNYSIPQTATLTAAQDDDTNLDNVTVTLSATGNVSATSVAVEITDDDAVNMDISPGNLTVMERGPTPGTIMVRLTRPPSADVTVAVASSNPLKATVGSATLTFTTTNYATAQNVQVSAVPDDDSRDEMVNVTFTATGISPAPPMRTVAVLVDDPDSQALQVTPAMVSVKEGETVTFDVKLTLNPGAASTVAVFSQNPAKLEVNPPFLTFNGTNFSTPQTVTVKSLSDDDLANDSVMVTLAGSAADNVNVPVTVMDDDTQRIELIASSPGTTLVMQETQVNGATSSSQVGVRLAFRPAAPVSVLLTSGNSSKLGLSRSTMTFSPSDYATVQLVTLTAPHDNDMVDDVVELSATAANASPTIPLAKLSVEIRDMDVLAFNISKSVLAELREGGTAYDKRSGGPNTVENEEKFKITLTVIPEHDVSAVVEVPPQLASKVEVTPPTCVLAGASSLATGCEITVRAREDQDAKDELVTLTIKDQAGVLASRSVSVAIDDRDVQSLQVTSTDTAFPNLVIPEGMAKEVKVALTAEPNDAASLLLTTSLANQLNLSATSPCSLGADGLLTTTGTWQTGCTVRIDAKADKDLSEQNLSLRFSALGLGIADVFVNIKKTDVNKQAVVLTRCNDAATEITDATLMTPFLVTENNATLSQIFCVALAFQPDVTNTITLTPSQIPIPLGPVVPNFRVSPSTLTFDAMTYATGQPITISALADDNIDDESGQVIVSVTPFADPRTLRFSILDVDHQGVLLGTEMVMPATVPPSGAKTLTLHERTQGAATGITSATMAVKLNRIPAKTMQSDAGSTETVTIRSPDGAVAVSGSGGTAAAACTGEPTSATFTFTNVTWNTEQTLTLFACPDSNTHGGTVTVTVKSDRLTTTPERTIEVTLDDQDIPYGVSVTVVGNGSVSSTTTPTDADNHEISSCRAGSSSTACQGTFQPKSNVRLTETPDANWEFDGWSCAPVGGGSTTNSSSSFLNVNMLSTPYQCTATFKPRLQISVVGNGKVDTMAPSSGIDTCRASTGDCTEGYDLDTSVKLAVTPNSGWQFSGWSGCVTPPVTDNPLTVVMSAPQSCTATFTEIVTP